MPPENGLSWLPAGLASVPQQGFAHVGCRRSDLILGRWIFLGVIVLVVLIALIAMIWMNRVVERNATETMARLDRLQARWTSPAAQRARQALTARNRP